MPEIEIPFDPATESLIRGRNGSFKPARCVIDMFNDPLNWCVNRLEFSIRFYSSRPCYQAPASMYLSYEEVRNLHHAFGQVLRDYAHIYEQQQLPGS